MRLLIDFRPEEGTQTTRHARARAARYADCSELPTYSQHQGAFTMFQHIKDLQFDARVSRPDPRFARMLLDQFGGGNGELKAAMQYYVQAFGCRRAYPDKYDLLMDVATEEFSHLEIVGATITMLLEGVNGELKDAIDQSDLTKLLSGPGVKEDYIH